MGNIINKVRNLIISRHNSLWYTIKHRKAFRQVEKRLCGKVSLRGWLHDIDKVVLKLFLDEEVVHNIHTHISRHHRRARTHGDYVQMIIDWECARITKPDKPLNARDTLKKFYPHMESTMNPIMDELGL